MIRVVILHTDNMARFEVANAWRANAIFDEACRQKTFVAAFQYNEFGNLDRVVIREKRLPDVSSIDKTP